MTQKILSIFLFSLITLSLTLANERSLKISKGNLHFNQKLYESLAKSKENLLFSSISLHTILSLLSQGAQTQTLSALSNVLNATKEDCKDGYKDIITYLNGLNGNDGIELNVANKIYVKNSYKLKDNFKKIAIDNYYSEIEPVNFLDKSVTVKSINDWIENKTNNKIHDLINQEDLDEFTRMILLNAIYFKGAWLNKFDKKRTKKSKFFISETESIDTDFMYQTAHFRHADVDELNAEILELPYTNNDVCMLIILPKNRTGIQELEEKLKNFNFRDVYKSMETVEARVKIPTFKIESTLVLDDPLKKLGLGSIFHNADLSDLLETKEELSVSKVIQKGFIEVNEEGSEAAVVSSVGIQGRSGRVWSLDEILFIADHPFIFSITVKQDTDTDLLYLPLFTGKLEQP